MFDPIRSKARTIVLTGAAFVGGALLASGLEWTSGSYAASRLQTVPSTSEVQPIADLNEAFISIAESITPTVVNITTERTQATRGNHPPVPEQFRRFFNLPEDFDPRDIPQQAGGSGFLITDDGYVVTNNHVVEDASRVTVTLRDRREFPAVVVGRDPTTDVAVIKIEGENLPTARLGRSEDVQVGEWVLAIGNPLGHLEFTVTSGIVSAKGRPLDIIQNTLRRRGDENANYAIEDFIQTDAAINPGNSGGPLVNLRGEVIGVNSAIASETGYSQGYGFAVPIDLVRRVADDLIRYGRSRRPVLGIQIAPVDPEDAEAFGLASVSGVVVQGFPDDSPARAAGLQQGDVIVAVDGKAVTRVNQLQSRIASRQPGETVSLDVVRYGEQQRVQVQLAEAPVAPVAAARAETQAPARESLGIQAQPLTAERAREFRFGQAGGVVIAAVEPFSVAQWKGIEEGWKIAHVDREPIRAIDQFQRVMKEKQPGEVVSLTLENGGGDRRIVNLRIPQ